MKKRPIVVLGRYRITQALSTDDVATTYAARDTASDQDVVVKVFSGVDRRLFRREVGAFAALDHPNVVALHQIGETPIGACMVSEHAGASLEARLAAGPLRGPELTQVAGDLLRALGAVHEAGLLHRDVKPANIFLADGRAKLGDFGAARLPSSRSTMEWIEDMPVKAGSLRYLSPERVRGDPDSEAGDLYGAAATIFEAHTGAPLIERCDGESVAGLIQRVACPPRITMQGPAGDWFRKALHPLAAQRFASAIEMADALEAFA